MRVLLIIRAFPFEYEKHHGLKNDFFYRDTQSCQWSSCELILVLENGRMKLFGRVFRDCYLSRSLIDESETQQKSP